MFDDFKAFLKRGNVLDMAVGVVIGVAFGAISKSLVDHVLMPLLGLVTGDISFTHWFVVLEKGTPTGPYATPEAAKAAGAVTLNYGNLIGVTLNFLIIAIAMFGVIRLMQALNQAGEPEEVPKTADPRRCPFCRTEVAEKATRCPACTSELDDVGEEAS